MTESNALLAYVQQILGRISQDKFGQRDAPVISLSKDTYELPGGELAGAVEVHIRTRDGNAPLIHAERFSNLRTRDEVDSLIARTLSVVLMKHAEWPR
jgi:hypothetical protein